MAGHHPHRSHHGGHVSDRTYVQKNYIRLRPIAIDSLHIFGQAICCELESKSDIEPMCRSVEIALVPETIRLNPADWGLFDFQCFWLFTVEDRLVLVQVFNS